MPITSVSSDANALTLTVVGDYPVPVERLWQAYADPRQLERFWGPETWPATFTRHDMAVGGRSEYCMTGPDGSTSRGWWRFLAVEPGRRMEVEDGFAHDDGRPNDAMPSMRMVFTFEPTDTGSRFTSVTHFPSLEAMQQLVDMGMEEGLRSALGQLDGVLADPVPLAADRAG
ncbi:MAG TPA: SRPBCC domain-containing protein [Longimicrobium sp.]|nr:SRPBCC domain-containing protein [Longimicrobium sp.]